jgi:hypothetical protein
VTKDLLEFYQSSSSLFRDVFSKSGVKKNKLVIIPEGLDTGLYDPAITVPYDLGSTNVKSKFKFLSVFKWEDRKGWDALLTAYFEVR